MNSFTRFTGAIAFTYVDMGADTWMKHGEFVTGAAAHAIAFYGNYGYVTNQGANTVSIINATSHLKIKDLAVGEKPNGIAFKPTIIFHLYYKHCFMQTM